MEKLKGCNMHTNREDLLEAASTGVFMDWELTVRERVFAEYAYEQSLRLDSLETAANELMTLNAAAYKALNGLEKHATSKAARDAMKTLLKGFVRFDAKRREVLGTR